MAETVNNDGGALAAGAAAYLAAALADGDEAGRVNKVVARIGAEIKQVRTEIPSPGSGVEDRLTALEAAVQTLTDNQASIVNAIAKSAGIAPPYPDLIPIPDPEFKPVYGTLFDKFKIVDEDLNALPSGGTYGVDQALIYRNGGAFALTETYRILGSNITPDSFQYPGGPIQVQIKRANNEIAEWTFTGLSLET